jgi:hypothetical protein
VVGCRFLHVDHDSIAKIDRVLSGGQEPHEQPGLSIAALRELVVVEDGDEPEEDTGSGWLSRIRRDR